MSMPEQQTFIAFGDLLRDLAQQCRAAEHYLRHSEQVQDDSTHSELAPSVARHQRQVADALERCSAAGDESLVMRRLQYTAGHRPWTAPHTLEQGLRQTLAINNAVVSLLQDESDKSAPITIGQQMADLKTQIHGINRRISLALVTARDL